MRIAYVVADKGIPVFGSKGASVHIREMVNAFAALGHEVTLNAALRGAEPSAFDANIVEVMGGTPADMEAMLSPDLAVKTRAKELHAMEISRAIHEELVRRHGRDRFDLIYERYSLWSDAGVRAARRLGVPCVVEVNAPLVVEQRRYREIVLAEEAEAIEAEVFANADALVTVSEELKRYAVSKGANPGRTHVVPNGVDVARFNPGVRAARIEGVDGAFVVGFAGRLRPWHGIEFLLDAFRLLHEEDADCHLLIVGDGQLRSWIEGYVHGARLGGKVTVTGWAAHERLPGFMKRMDVAVAPYPPIDDFYFSPLKLYEYLAVGKPIVASAIGQLREVIDDGVTGLLARPGDAADLAAKIGCLRRDPGLRQRLGRAAARRAGDCTWEDNARRVIDLAGAVSRAA